MAAADVEHMSGRFRRFQREAAGLGDVVDAHKVALLKAILEDEGRFVIQEPGSENGQNSGVGIR